MPSARLGIFFHQHSYRIFSGQVGYSGEIRPQWHPDPGYFESQGATSQFRQQVTSDDELDDELDTEKN